MTPSRTDPRVLAAALFTITLWASTFPVTRYALRVFSPEDVSLLRLLSASAVLALYALLTRMRLPHTPRDWLLFAGFGLVGLSLANLCLSFGLRTISAGAGSFLVGAIPLFSALWASTFLKERIGPLGWLGIAVSFGGMGLIAMGEGQRLEGNTLFNPGALFVLASAFLQSLFYVFQKPMLRRYSPVQVTCYAIWFGTGFLLPLLPGLWRSLGSAPPGATVAGVYLGVFPIAVAFVAWSYALSRAKAAKVTSAMYAMPALALTLSFFWLGEVPTVLTLAGGAVALSGVALLNLWGR